MRHSPQGISASETVYYCCFKRLIYLLDLFWSLTLQEAESQIKFANISLSLKTFARYADILLHANQRHEKRHRKPRATISLRDHRKILSSLLKVTNRIPVENLTNTYVQKQEFEPCYTGVICIGDNFPFFLRSINFLFQSLLAGRNRRFLKTYWSYMSPDTKIKRIGVYLCFQQQRTNHRYILLLLQTVIRNIGKRNKKVSLKMQSDLNFLCLLVLSYSHNRLINLEHKISAL